MAESHTPTPADLGADDVVHYRHTIAGGPTNTRQKITVEVISLVDNGVTTPPLITTFGSLDLSPDQALELADALHQARTVYTDALKAWYTGLTPQNTP